jgi:hypothetical protein
MTRWAFGAGNGCAGGERGGDGCCDHCGGVAARGSLAAAQEARLARLAEERQASLLLLGSIGDQVTELQSLAERFQSDGPDYRERQRSLRTALLLRGEPLPAVRRLADPGTTPDQELFEAAFRELQGAMQAGT